MERVRRVIDRSKDGSSTGKMILFLDQFREWIRSTIKDDGWTIPKDCVPFDVRKCVCVGSQSKVEVVAWSQVPENRKKE